MSKGDKRIAESKPGSYGRGYDGIDWSGSPVPLICTACNTEPCDCQVTEDGPGQDGEQSDMGNHISGPGQDEASQEVKTHYERRRFDREGV
jgi:hypothetical protein